MKRTNDAPQVLDETVRRRLAALLDDVPARRAAPDGQTEVTDPFPAFGGGAPEPPASAPHLVDDDDPKSAASRGASAAKRAWAFGRQHATLVGVILLGACLWAGYTAAQARSTQIDTSPPVSVTAAPTVTPSGSPPAPSVAPLRIQVHVIGGVKKPGVVEVPEGARIGDVLQAAGGLAKNGDPGELNLAEPAVDGSQIVVGTKTKPRGEVRMGGESVETSGGAAPGSSGPGAATSGMISLNTATAAQLETLPGVGPVTASKIIAWREAHEKFTDVSELQEVSGIGPKTYAEIAPHVRV